MKAGRLRHKITIQTVTETRDSHGGISSSWSTFAQVWAGVKPLKGEEYFKAMERQARIDHEVTIRYLSGVTPKMRVSWGSRLFNIMSVINTHERNHEMVLMCEEVV